MTVSVASSRKCTGSHFVLLKVNRWFSIKPISMALRSKYVDSIFGSLKTFELNQLPTNEDIIKNVLLKPGTLIHSRFLTTTNAIMRLYISTKNPSKKLKLLVKFVMTVYAPMWFQIKTKSNMGRSTYL